MRADLTLIDEHRFPNCVVYLRHRLGHCLSFR